MDRRSLLSGAVTGAFIGPVTAWMASRPAISQPGRASDLEHVTSMILGRGVGVVSVAFQVSPDLVVIGEAKQELDGTISLLLTGYRQ